MQALEPIAVIGFSFRLPQNVEDEMRFWDVLESRRNLMTEWPSDRVNIDSFFDREGTKPNMLSSRGAHFLTGDLAAFDAPFFSITAKEAAAMDPQHRLTLETTFRAFENAGIPVETIRGSRTSVFAASMCDDYTQMHSKDPDSAPRMVIVGTPSSLLANRVSYHFDLVGPSVHIDTACSGSTVAVDLACQSLRSGDATLAVAASANLLLGPEESVLMSNINFLSKQSVCYSFDHRATGYGRGEGVVCFILKPVSRAIQDGDMIRAVIRSSASNSDGRTAVLPQPNPNSQEELIRHVYRKAGLTLDDTRYLEAHGTGTGVGDPIEMKAIGNAFKGVRSQEEPLYVGSVKTNTGHLEAASGLTGMLKAILILERGIILPCALFEKPNPEIPLETYNVQIPTKCIPWPKEGRRRVSVNSFGFGGSNCHVILDDAYHYLKERGLVANHRTVPSPKTCPSTNGVTHQPRLLINGHFHPMNEVHVDQITGAADTNEGCFQDSMKALTSNGNRINTIAVNLSKQLAAPRLVVWTASDESSLRRVVEGYRGYYSREIAGNPAKLDQLAFTLATRRSHMAWRTFAIVNADTGDATKSLSTVKPSRASPETGLAFVFTGQGAQYVNMGLELLQYQVFEHTLQQINHIYGRLGCGWSVLDELRKDENLDKPEYSQPLCTALQIALVELLGDFSIVPNSVVGHSSGEIAAAYAVGGLTLESACKVAYYRGQVAGKLKASSAPGSMASVNLPESKVRACLKKMNCPDLTDSICVACVNSPLNSTLSGPEEAIDFVQQMLDKDGIFAQKLKTGIAYHSPSMQQAAAEYISLLGTLETTKAGSSTIMVSSVTAEPVSTSSLSDARYWVDNLVRPVKFSEALVTLLQGSLRNVSRKQTISDIVEVGPHSALRRPIQETLRETISRKKQPRYFALLNKTKSPVRCALELLGHLFCHGYCVSIGAANQSQPGASGPIPFLVDCPEYPFDHSRTYWAESRLSRDYRFRKGGAPGSLLGNRFHDWNPLEPRWRNTSSLESAPWLADHEVSGVMVYPGTAMLVMAMEAVKQMSPPNRQVSGYLFKEANFQSPILVQKESEGMTETMVHLRPIQRPYEKDPSWFDIKIFAYTKDRWTESFAALVQLQHEELADEIDGGREWRLDNERILREYHGAVELCTTPITKKDFYNFCVEHGHNYGESFQLLEDIRWSGGERSIGRIDTLALKYPTAHVVHPAMLDAALHIFLVQSSAGLSHSSPTFVPRHMKNAWIASSGWQYPRTRSVRLSVTTRYKAGGLGLEGAAFAIDDSSKPLWVMPSVELFSVSTNDNKYAAANKLVYGLEWKPQFSLLSPQQLRQLCQAETFTRDETAMIHYFQRLGFTLEKVLRKTSEQLTDEDRKRTPAHLLRYLSWMDYYVKQQAEGPGALSVQTGVDKVELEQLLQEVEALHPPWQMFPTIARNLKPLLCGEIDPLELVFSSDLAENVYEERFDGICDHRLQRLLDLMSHENPNLRIIEVGAGTGRVTNRILSYLDELEQQSGSTKFSEYTYTDISPAFFEKAAARFHKFSDRILFKPFDLECDGSAQGINAGAYDLVIAGSVLHATTNLAVTLKHIHKVLKKPGGRMIFIEMTDPGKIITNFGFGVFPGWWLCEEEWRTLSPTITVPHWDGLLRENGFSGNDVVFRDHKSDIPHLMSIIATSAMEPEQQDTEASTSRLLVVLDKQSDKQVRLAECIHHNLPKSTCWELTCLSLANLAASSDLGATCTDVVVNLLETESPLLIGMPEDVLVSLQKSMEKAQNWLWVTRTSPDSKEYAEYSLASGFLRVMRSEAFEKRIITVSIECVDSEPEKLARPIANILHASFRLNAPEIEYWVRGGKILSSRLVEDNSVNDAMHSIVSPQPKKGPWLPGPALRLSMETPGVLDSFQFVEDSSLQTELDPDEVEFECKAWGLSFRDLFIALGRLDETVDEAGHDCAGIVTRVGLGCQSEFQPGDRICAGVLGCMRTYARARSSLVFKIPDTLSFDKAASLFSPGVTAYYALVEVARLRKADTILIHSGAGGTGQMAICIARMIGADIFVTVGFEHKKQLLMSEFGLPEDRIFYSRNSSFAKGILRATNGRGVDVVLNSLAGDGLMASWECVAPFGRFIEIGKADIMADSSLPMSGFKRNVSFAAVDAFHLVSSNTALAAELMAKVIDLATTGVINCPSPLHLYPISDIEQAFRYFQSGRNTGRIIISVDHSDVVQKLHVERSSWHFKHDASYMIAGGLGGVGRAILEWMAGKGARNLIVPSRSGATSPAAIGVVSKLRDNGVNIYIPKCDVSDAVALSDVLDECVRRGMPPIKGCVNAAMVLQDAVFGNMSHAQWELTIRSKVLTSRNLHELLPPDLDFFILFSSLGGVYGNVAQSNYAAGCTYQDALARHRVANGQRGVSFDIGWMRNIGIIAETEVYRRRRENEANMAQIDDVHLLALLDLYCDPACPHVPSVDNTQVLIGAVTPAMVLARGGEPPAHFLRPFLSGFSQLRSEPSGTPGTGGRDKATDDSALRFQAAASAEERADVVVAALRARLARALFVSVDDIEPAKTLPDYGVDSLMAVELRNWIRKDFKADVAIFDIMGVNRSVSAIGAFVIEKSGIRSV